MFDFPLPQLKDSHNSAQIVLCVCVYCLQACGAKVLVFFSWDDDSMSRPTLPLIGWKSLHYVGLLRHEDWWLARVRVLIRYIWVSPPGAPSRASGKWGNKLEWEKKIKRGSLWFSTREIGGLACDCVRMHNWRSMRWTWQLWCIIPILLFLLNWMLSLHVVQMCA